MDKIQTKLNGGKPFIITQGKQEIGKFPHVITPDNYQGEIKYKLGIIFTDEQADALNARFKAEFDKTYEMAKKAGKKFDKHEPIVGFRFKEVEDRVLDEENSKEDDRVYKDVIREGYKLLELKTTKKPKIFKGANPVSDLSFFPEGRSEFKQGDTVGVRVCMGNAQYQTIGSPSKTIAAVVYIDSVQVGDFKGGGFDDGEQFEDDSDPYDVDGGDNFEDEDMD